METKIYLALYKNKRSWRQEPLKALADCVTRKLTKGQYSHCEIAVQKTVFTRGSHYEQESYFECYSSSVQDGGVRCKEINLTDGKWDLIELKNITESQIKAYFEQTKGKAYDWWGALGVVLGIKQKRSKFFCSEWCFNAIFNSQNGWRFSPNDLAVMGDKW
ncbi:enoyl-CoA hydratase [Lonepinella koalarum]|uniref:enoyl-CoA hydratase n=1 Tax=Lonepinella koalarum TaxID=53417 RepID=UPI0011E3FCF3|nr:enoyl-CoA hydratase [Lonepinella koalarum]TYG34148.1 enoyl-CoA hydratase [Lonepinella koalarum]